MGSGHTHSHDGHEPHQPHTSFYTLRFIFALITAFMLLEMVTGWLFHSLALISDGLHMLSDALSLGFSAYAVSLGTRRADGKKTFGYKRFEVLAAFANGLTLTLLALFICVQAAQRLYSPEIVQAKSMLGIAVIGLLVNIFAAWKLHHGEDEKTLNEESALWHIWGDLFSSLAAIVAALGILWKGWQWLDPSLSLFIALVVGWGGIGVMRRSSHILVEGAPKGFDIEKVRARLKTQVEVESVHDLHVWSMNGRDIYLSAHIALRIGTLNEKTILNTLSQLLRHEYHIQHITLQLGPCKDDDCTNNCENEMATL